VRASNEERLAALLDHHEIEECLLRYCRGIDRHDADLAKSAYHADGRDDHAAYIGSGHGLVEWANGYHDEHYSGHQHYITNTTIDLDGDTAHAETYFLFAATNKDAHDHALGGGRYIDRFERNGGRWEIADRVCIVEWWNDVETMAAVAPLVVPPAQDRSDPSYRRPLRAEREDRIVFGPASAASAARS
jgi:hypothetical protein